MDLKARWRPLDRPIGLVQPVLPALMVTGAAVAAIAQPLANPEPKPSLTPAPHLEQTPSARLAAASVRFQSGSKFNDGIRASAPPEPAKAPVRMPPAEFVPVVRIALPASKPAVAIPAPAQPEPSVAEPIALVQPSPRPLTPPLGGTRLDAPDHASVGPAPSQSDFSRRLVDEPTWMSMARAAARSGSRAELADESAVRDHRLALTGKRQPIFNDEPAEPVKLVRPEPEEAAEGISRYGMTEQGIAFTVPVQLNRSPAGNIALLINDGHNISVRLADILTVLKLAMAQDRFETLSASAAAQEYVTLNDLRAAGIAVTFASDDRLMLGTS